MWRLRIRSKGLARLSDTMSCCLKYYSNRYQRSSSTHLECPLLITKSLLVFVNVSLSDVISMELHVCPPVEEVWHPVHVSTGGVQEADLVLAEDPLEMISHRVEDTDHSSSGCFGAAWSTLRLLVTPEPPFLSIDLLKTLLPHLIILFLLKKIQ